MCDCERILVKQGWIISEDRFHMTEKFVTNTTHQASTDRFLGDSSGPQQSYLIGADFFSTPTELGMNDT